MKNKITLCYDKNSREVAAIYNDAISAMTWHENGLYIYWSTWQPEMETYFRAGCIICDWTLTIAEDDERVADFPVVINGAEEEDTLIIFR